MAGQQSVYRFFNPSGAIEIPEMNHCIKAYTFLHPHSKAEKRRGRALAGSQRGCRVLPVDYQGSGIRPIG
jgi:hypothetical protein